MKRELSAYLGSMPVLDGVLSPGEWDDATMFEGVMDWTATFSPVTDPADLAVRVWVKHDHECLYLAFDVTDDVLYGIDIPRWLPDGNPDVHELTPNGWPWFGDGIQLMIDSEHSERDEDPEGSGLSWQMVYNLTKSRLGGVGVGGLLEGEPKAKPSAWQTYQNWILTGAQRAVGKVKPGGKGYVVEWAIKFNPCLEIAPGRFYHPSLGEVVVGLNIGMFDLDEKEKGTGNFGNIHHKNWLTGGPGTRRPKSLFANLWLEQEERPRSATFSCT